MTGFLLFPQIRTTEAFICYPLNNTSSGLDLHLNWVLSPTRSETNMLSTTSTASSVSDRRTFHRRLQSLETPTLIHPGIPRRRQTHGQPGHRRGQSLDQRLVAASNTLSGLRPISIQDSTNTGKQIDSQHFKQDTQQLMTSQPGFNELDFPNNIPSQTNGCFNTPLSASIPSDPNQQIAFQELQQHLNWYTQTYGKSPTTLLDNANVQPMDYTNVAAMPVTPTSVIMPMSSKTQTVIKPSTQRRQGSIPDTPQTFAPAWSSPRLSHMKNTSGQDFHLDVAPMPIQASATLQNVMYSSETKQTTQLADETPLPSEFTPAMPTLFEDLVSSDLQINSMLVQGPLTCMPELTETDLIYSIQIPPVSPRQALLNQIGSDMPASIVETGILLQDVQQYIGPLDEADKKYPCLYHGCNKRFGRKENVRAHVQTHLGDRQFRCDVCEKTFVRQHDLKRHIGIHSDERPHTCICGQSFARHDALTRHRQRGMCIGALPGYEKDPAELPKRGRPRKERPSTADRTDKASRQRRMNKERCDARGPNNYSHYASSNYSASERSFPLTPPDTSDVFDTAAFLNISQGDNQFGIESENWRASPPSSPFLSNQSKTVDGGRHAIQQRPPLRCPEQGISPAVLSNHSSPSGPRSATTEYDQGSSPPELHEMSFDCNSSESGRRSFDGGSSPVDFALFSDAFDGIDVQPDAVQDMFSPPGESLAGSSVYNYSDYDASALPKKLALSTISDTFADNGALVDFGPELAEAPDMADMLNNWLSSN